MFPTMRATAGPRLTVTLLLGLMLGRNLLASEPEGIQTVAVQLGAYQITPNEFTVQAGRPVRLELTNTDAITLHNFTLKDPAAGLNIDMDVPPGATRTVELTPEVPGSYPYYCNKELPFVKSHRERGMEGTLTVLPAD
jgi:heme/copper-type cytochrome/quinol oxidase subunit 2